MNDERKNKNYTTQYKLFKRLEFIISLDLANTNSSPESVKRFKQIEIALRANAYNCRKHKIIILIKLNHINIHFSIFFFCYLFSDPCGMLY